MSEPAVADTPQPPRADVAIGAFTDDGPWELDLDRISWRAAVPEVRRRVQRELPELVRPRKVPPGLRVFRVARHLGVGLAAWALIDRRQGGSVSRAGISRRLREAAEALGPTYIKLGQIISSGEGIFPPELVVEFKKCRDQVPPEPFPVVREVVEADLGRPLRRGVLVVRATPARRRLDRPGPRRHPA